MRKIRNFTILLFFICLFLFSGCGLDTYYVLDEPGTAYNTPSVDSSSYTSSTVYSSAYFDFSTRDGSGNNKSNGDFTFEGTAVYYKIYRDYTLMNSHRTTVDSLVTSTNASSSATKIIQDYKYVQLGSDKGSLSPLIPECGSTQRIYIRLTNYQASADWQAEIRIQNENGTVVQERYIPMRTGNSKSFDFGRKNSDGNYDKPQEGDDDVYWSSSSSEEDMWYVNLYAVSVGRDNTFTSYYSPVLWLGSVAIDASSEDN